MFLRVNNIFVLTKNRFYNFFGGSVLLRSPNFRLLTRPFYTRFQTCPLNSILVFHTWHLNQAGLELGPICLYFILFFFLPSSLRLFSWRKDKYAVYSSSVHVFCLSKRTSFTRMRHHSVILPHRYTVKYFKCDLKNRSRPLIFSNAPEPRFICRELFFVMVTSLCLSLFLQVIWKEINTLMLFRGSLRHYSQFETKMAMTHLKHFKNHTVQILQSGTSFL